MTEVGQRLRVAIQEHPDMSIAALSRALEEEGASGASRPSIHAYIADDADREPSLDFLRAAAEVLEVRPAWLILGQGSRTATQERMEEQNLRERLIRRVPTLREVPRGTQSLWVETLRALVETAPNAEELAGSNLLELETFVRQSERLEWLLWFPLSQWGFQRRGELDQSQWETYVAFMLAGLSLVVRERGTGDPLSEIDDKLEELRQSFEARVAAQGDG